MTWNHLIRQIHRWASIAFVTGVISYIVILVVLHQRQPPGWVNLIALVPLFTLMGTGLWMFALPYVTRWRGARTPAAASPARA